MKRRTRRAPGMRGTLVLSAVVAATLFAGQVAVGNTQGDELPPGTYRYLAPEFDTPVEVHYVSADLWLKVVPHQQTGQPERWEVKDGDLRYTAFGGDPAPGQMGEIAVGDGMRDLAPERFILDAKFLRHLQRGTLPPGYQVRASERRAAAAQDRGRRQVDVPEQLSMPMDALRIVEFTSAVEVDPRDHLEQKLASGRYEVVHLRERHGIDDPAADEPVHVDTPPPS